MKQFTVKEIQTLLNKRKAEKTVIEMEIENKRQQLNLIDGEIANLTEKLSSSKQSNPVSEHAIVRFLERVRGVDIEEVRCEIAEYMRKFPFSTGEYKTEINGKMYKFVIKNNHVVTIV